VNDAELVELGLYDPDAPGAAERIELLRIAFEHGATVEEVRNGIEERRLHAIAAIRVIAGGSEQLSLETAAERAGVEIEFARRCWRALGLPDPAPGTAACTERDIEALQALDALRHVISEDASLQFARTAGASLARLADTEVALVRSASEAPLRAEGGGNVEVARMFLDMARDLVPMTLPLLDAVHRHHIIANGRRYALWGTAPTESSTTNACVGFVDLVGFTTLGSQLEATDLDALVRCFEQEALDATRRPLARLVKLIGDEAMFVAGGADDAVEIVEAMFAAPDLPLMRAGLAAGTLVVREGDVFGPVVNLAARLVSLASPGQMVLDAQAAERLGRSRVTSLGARHVAGLDEPVEIFTLAGSDGESES